MDTNTDCYEIRVHCDGQELSSDMFDAEDDNALGKEFSEVIAFIPKHYPDPSGITVDAVHPSGDVKLSHTFA